MRRHKLGLALITGLGLGRLRPAPGTIGSLPPVLLVMIVAWQLAPRLSHQEYTAALNVSLSVLLGISSAICLGFGSIAEGRFGRKDPPDVVADEIAGQSIALLFLPWRSEPSPKALAWNLSLAGAAFLAFRLMDIIKPPPAKSLQRLPGGTGILIDDIVAGIYALVLTQIMARFVWPVVLG
ncbi:MAG: phosphatidylglycerophosphatase A [Phycisphaerales bacterium]|nr:phosphatidylglycerophosphatase A [Phycisphaerales bacterium]MCI0632260.1 phosphatidylglycerophosphatase A [Phycisphaerales bacterium]MCI0676956.1 phosphatidylglycerophosphatase A [Phycisphaerales bacterium]